MERGREMEGAQFCSPGRVIFYDLTLIFFCLSSLHLDFHVSFTLHPEVIRK